MYTKISNPSIVIYDGKTGELIGTATFKLTDKSEKALLNLLNYNIQPSSLTLLDVDLYKPSPNYTPPMPYSPYMRKGTICIFRQHLNTESGGFEHQNGNT